MYDTIPENDTVDYSDELLDNPYGYIDIKKPDEQQISFQLIRKRNLGDLSSYRNSANIAVDRSQQAELQAQNLLNLTHIHLDRENITHIDNLAEYLGPVTNLYLQHNKIEKIENLEFLSKLKFLTLSHNQISVIENLKSLKTLQYLDVSFNKIEKFDVQELPRGLIIFDIRDNPCVNAEVWSSQRDSLLNHLPKITQLNGEELYDLIKDGFDEEEDGMDADKLDFIRDDEQKDTSIKVHDFANKIVQRSKLRQKQFKIMSEKHFEQMKNELEASNSNLLEMLKSTRRSMNYDS